MNLVEMAAERAISVGDLQPLERANGSAPVLGTPAIAATVAAATALFAAGNMITDFVGHEAAVGADESSLRAKSGAELLGVRRAALRA